ncbi:MFS transporter [Variovorax paradoxus]|uniref:MFS transporter n=1 Tax=Variovorax paradoxus TaxID=34073 RepID=UPI0021607855|nr:MFS transporter [Variovorax paradoxus]UVH55612.1 MFS transporter [Variovorax paradoxus]
MDASTKIDSRTTMFALAICMVTGMGTIQMQPVLGGALVDRMGIGLQQMGVLFGIELVSMALACTVAAFGAHRQNRQQLVRIALVVLLIASVWSTLAESFATLCVARLLAGASGGVVQAVVYASTALRTHKDKTFAVLNICILLWGAASLGILPPVISAFGIPAVFAGFVVLCLLSLGLCGRIPARAPASGQGGPGRAAVYALRTDSTLLLVLVVLLFAGHGALWVYQERIGKAIGIAPDHIGMILGLSVLSGAVGAALAGIVGRRISHRSAQLIAFAGSILATLLMVYGTGVAAYALTACVIMLVWFFGLTYLLALTAEMDQTGRLPGLANAAIFIGQALGPAVGAVAVGTGSFRSVGWAATAIYVIALALSVVVTSHHARSERHRVRSPLGST